MNILKTFKELYAPHVEQREYIVSRVNLYDGNPNLHTLSIEVTASAEVIEVLRRELVSKAYLTLASSTEWGTK